MTDKKKTETLMIVETLTHAQFHVLTEEHVDRLGRLIDAYQQLRPVGSNGKHGDRHADHCGCTGNRQKRDRSVRSEFVPDLGSIRNAGDFRYPVFDCERHYS